MSVVTASPTVVKVETVFIKHVTFLTKLIPPHLSFSAYYSFTVIQALGEMGTAHPVVPLGLLLTVH